MHRVTEHNSICKSIHRIECNVIRRGSVPFINCLSLFIIYFVKLLQHSSKLHCVIYFYKPLRSMNVIIENIRYAYNMYIIHECASNYDLLQGCCIETVPGARGPR
jgi:hypothetical protein